MSKYLGQCDISVVYDNKIILDDVVESVTWSGDITHPFRELTLSVVNKTRKSSRYVEFEKGKPIALFNFGKELFRGVLFADDIDTQGIHNLKAIDEAIYLTNNLDSRKFTKIKASDIIKRICADFGIPVGQIADTGYVIPKLIMPNKTLYDMIITALTVTKKQTGKRFFLIMQNGKLNLYKRNDIISEMYIESGKTLTNASYSQSIEELRNQVKVVGGDDKSPVVVTVKNDTLIGKYGLMQHLEEDSEAKTKAQAEQKARQLLKDLAVIEDDASVEALGNDKVIAGSSLYVNEPITRIKGGYYVVTDSHTFQNGTHTMSLSLSATDDLPEIEYEEA